MRWSYYRSHAIGRGHRSRRTPRRTLTGPLPRQRRRRRRSRASCSADVHFYCASGAPNIVLTPPCIGADSMMAPCRPRRSPSPTVWTVTLAPSTRRICWSSDCSSCDAHRGKFSMPAHRRTSCADPAARRAAYRIPGVLIVRSSAKTTFRSQRCTSTFVFRPRRCRRALLLWPCHQRPVRMLHPSCRRLLLLPRRRRRYSQRGREGRA